MDLLVHGHAGAKVLVFPSSMGRFYEWEDRGMIGALGDYIRDGWFQLYCVDSVDEESWYARWKHPGDRAWRHMQYERYLLDEVLPLAWRMNSTPYVIATGASFGAYHAMNLALRHPHAINRVIAMSGMYDIKIVMPESHDPNVLANDPSQYMIHLDDPGHLEAIRGVNIIIAVGKEDPNIENNRWFSGLLWRRNIWHAFREWDGWSHDWPYWQQMIRTYIHGND